MFYESAVFFYFCSLKAVKLSNLTQWRIFKTGLSFISYSFENATKPAQSLWSTVKSLEKILIGKNGKRIKALSHYICFIVKKQWNNAMKHHIIKTAWNRALKHLEIPRNRALKLLETGTKHLETAWNRAVKQLETPWNSVKQGSETPWNTLKQHEAGQWNILKHL